jgi:glutathione S-transferase
MALPPPRGKLYYDPLSQPSRACLIFCRAAGVDVKEVRVALRKGEQRRDSFRAINPFGKVPFLVEVEVFDVKPDEQPDPRRSVLFSLPESCAILRYLCATAGVEKHWYPREPRARAVVDAALDWHHSTLRRGASSLVFLRFFAGISGEDDRRVKEALSFLCPALAHLADYWLPDELAFIGGAKHVSIADLVLACEVSQLALLRLPPTVLELVPPSVASWMGRVERATAPHWAAVHAELAAIGAAGPLPRSRG